MGQASELTLTKLKSIKDFKDMEKKRNCKWSLDNINHITHKTESSVHLVKCVVDLCRKLHTHRQGKDQTLMDCTEQLQSIAKTCKDANPSGGKISARSSMKGILVNIYSKHGGADPLSSSEEMSKYDAWSNDHVLGMVLICNVDKNRCGKLEIKLANDYVKGINNYPPAFAECFGLLLNHTPSKSSKPNKGKDKNDKDHEGGLALVQRQAKPTSGANGKVCSNIECKKYKSHRHHASYCPGIADEDAKEGVGLAQFRMHVPPSECHVNFNQIAFIQRARIRPPS